MPEFDLYVIGLTILVIVQWGLQALRDRKVTPDEWSDLIDLVTSRVVAAHDKQKVSKPKITNKTKSNIKERKK